MHLLVKGSLGVILSKVLYIADILSLSLKRLETNFESVFSLQLSSKLIVVPTIQVQIVVMNTLTQNDNVCEAGNIL